MKLYEISEQYRALQELLDEGMIDAQTFADTLETIESSFADKARNCVMLQREFEARLSAIKAEKERLSKLEKAQQTAIDRIEEYLRANMLATNHDKLDLGIFGLTLKKASLKLPDGIDESDIPSEYFKVIPETKTLDKVALLSAAKLGKVNIELVEGKRALLIK
jgi:ElaB/YqjD/DUF883 family membrane-anchored ribosome-binding protein